MKKPWHHPIYGDVWTDPLEDFGGKLLGYGVLGGLIGGLLAFLSHLLIG